MKRRFAFLLIGLAVVSALGVSVRQLQASTPICTDYLCSLSSECTGIPEITCKSCYEHRCREN